jgi:hypothetical protein
LNTGFDGIDPSLLGQKAIFYLPKDDEDHHVVYMKTESGLNLACSFSESGWSKVHDDRLQDELKNLISALE